MVTDTSIRLYLLLIAGVYSIDIRDPEPAELQPLFESLKQHGAPEVEKMQKEHPDLNLQQYLVAAVLTQEEFHKAETWSSNDLAVLKEEGRVKTYINEVRKDQGKKPFHGEMMFLQDEGGIEDMATQVRSKAGDDAVPFVVMYSYYIPCAHVSKLKYSCSEELAREAASRKYPMFLSFSDVFEQTSKANSALYMALGEIKVFVEGTPYVKFSYTPEETPATGGIFQILYSNCLKEMGVANCEGQTIEEAVQVRFVNIVVYECTKDSRVAGMLTMYNRREFVKCLSNFINNCNSCNRCSQQTIVSYVYQFCAVSILRPGLVFGAGKDVDDNSWQRYEGPWKYIFRTPPDYKTLPSLPCNARANALQDCVKTLKDKAKELPDAYDLSQDVRTGISKYLKEQKKQGQGRRNIS